MSQPGKRVSRGSTDHHFSITTWHGLPNTEYRCDTTLVRYGLISKDIILQYAVFGIVYLLFTWINCLRYIDNATCIHDTLGSSSSLSQMSAGESQFMNVFVPSNSYKLNTCMAIHKQFKFRNFLLNASSLLLSNSYNCINECTFYICKSGHRTKLLYLSLYKLNFT